jgi:hypothetical protein
LNWQEKLAAGTLKLKANCDELQERCGLLEEELANFQKRAQIEELLLEARGKPTKLNTATIDEFLAKRAHLENHSIQSLEKIGGYLDLVENEDGIEISDESDSPNGNSFVEWILSKS